MVRSEEELGVTRRDEQFGTARLHKTVVEREVREVVELHADDYRVLEQEVADPDADSGRTEKAPEGDLSVPVLAERFVVRKEVYVVKRLVLQRTRRPHARETVAETLRAERVVAEIDHAPSPGGTHACALRRRRGPLEGADAGDPAPRRRPGRHPRHDPGPDAHHPSRDAGGRRPRGGGGAASRSAHPVRSRRWHAGPEAEGPGARDGGHRAGGAGGRHRGTTREPTIGGDMTTGREAGAAGAAGGQDREGADADERNRPLGGRTGDEPDPHRFAADEEQADGAAGAREARTPGMGS